MRKRMPSDFDEPVRFFGRFTWPDLIRLGLPVAVLTGLVGTASVWPMLLAVVLGAGVGLAWYVIRPYGLPLEVHLYHRLRWLLRREGSS